MPIHINLLAEAQAAEELRRHDPVKHAIFIGISLVAVTLVWSGLVEINALLAKERFAGVQSDVNAKTNAYQHVMADKDKIATIQAKLDALQKLQAARFLQGSLLDALQHATVDDVQLTRVHVDQSYILTEGTEAQTNDDRVIPGRQDGQGKDPLRISMRGITTAPIPANRLASSRMSWPRSVTSKTCWTKRTGCSSPTRLPRRKAMAGNRM